MNKKKLKIDFSHKKYGFFEDASIQICEWNKKALKGEGVCYKQDFYGADTISCHQIAPTTFWCNNSCIFCWRPNEYMGSKPDCVIDPGKMVSGLVKERRKLLTGFNGNLKVSKENYLKSLQTKHWAISLSGEPTLYKKLPKLIKILKERKETETVFLVSNGENPKMLQKLSKENSLPTQLYISMVSPNKKVFKIVTCNNEKDGWKKYVKTLSLLKDFSCRTVIRLTLIKGFNDSENLVEEFASLLEKTKTDFIEIKSYMWLGNSRQRLNKINSPLFKNVKDFSNKLLLLMPSYKYECGKENSRIVLLKNKNSKFKTKIIERD